MGVADSDPVVRSSIALLQERFKQLHREKRRREEREFLRLLSSNSATSFGATDAHLTSQFINHASKRRRLVRSEILLTEKPPLKALSLRPGSTSNCQTELWDVKASIAKKMLSEDRLTLRDSSLELGHFETDVDTSLHL